MGFQFHPSDLVGLGIRLSYQLSAVKPEMEQRINNTVVEAEDEDAINLSGLYLGFEISFSF